MARSDFIETAAGQRILANTQHRKQAEPPQQDANDSAERLLSRPVSISKKRKRRKRVKSETGVLRILVVSTIVVAALGFIIWFRGFAQEFGIIWIGDQ
jgi:hypothetical protein